MSQGRHPTRARPSIGSRAPGVLKGRVWMAPDFDRTPPEVIDAFEGADDRDTGFEQAPGPQDVEGAEHPRRD